MIVPINEVVVHHEPLSWGVKQMMRVLEKQGQIEPLQVRRVGEAWMTFSSDPWGAETVRAARLLGWPTLLICPAKRYLP